MNDDDDKIVVRYYSQEATGNYRAVRDGMYTEMRCKVLYLDGTTANIIEDVFRPNKDYDYVVN